MLIPVLTFKIQSDHSLVTLRDRCRHVGELFGLELLQRTRLTTAVSEVGRNALQYAGAASVNFLFGNSTSRPGLQSLLVQVVDKGPGLPPSVWSGGVLLPNAEPGGLQGSQKLVDTFGITSMPDEGTSVTLEVLVPRDISPLTLAAVGLRTDELLRRKPQNPREELEHQNREMLHALDQLRRRQADLEHADQRKNEFVAMLAHELRNPLAVISMTVELMRRKNVLVQADVEKYRDTIGRQASQLTRLVDDLMDVSRVSRGKVDLKPEVVEAGALVAQSIEMTQAFVDAKNHRLSVSLPDVPVWIDVDLVRMKQVLSNLIHNAARYTPDGGLIKVSLQAERGEVQIRVKDNGIGIDAEMLPRIFDLFTQVESNLQRQDVGLGIGLTIVQRLVRDHGGTVTAHSDGLTLGSEFVVTLPTVEAPVAKADGAFSNVSGVDERKLLLVDDNEDAALAMEEVFRLSGYDCVIARDGAQGLAAARASPPEIAIVDIGLPVIDGFGVARELRKLLGPQVLLIALTGYSAAETRARAEEAGFDDYFVKPVNFPLLLQRLELRGAAGVTSS